MAVTLAEAALVIRADMSKVKGEITSGTKQAAAKAGESSGAAFGEKFSGSVKGFAGRAAGAVGVLTTAVTGVGLAGLVTFGLKSAASLEQAQIGFETLLGSGKKAATFLSGLQKFAAQTPFELPGLIDASRTLLGVGVSAKEVVPLLQAFGDTAGAVGIKQDAFQRIMIATSQSISAGRFNLGDLNQIMTNGIPIYTILSKALGKPVVEIRKMATAGKLLSKDVLPALQKEMEKDYGGAMARQSQTLAGVWSTLTDTVSIGLANALKPLVPMLSQFIPKAAAAASTALSAASGTMVAFINGLQLKGKSAGGFLGTVNLIGRGLRSLIEAFREGDVTSNGFVGVMERIGVALRNAWPNVVHLVSVLRAGLSATLSAILPVLGSVVAFFYNHATAAKALAIAMGALVVVTRAHAAALAVEAAGGLIKYISSIRIVTALTKVWAAVQWLLNAALDASPIALVVIGLAALVAGVVLAWRNSETFRRIVIGAWNGIKAAVGAVASWFMTYVWPTLAATWKGIAAGAMWMWNNVIHPVVNALVAFFRNVVAPVFTWLWKNVVSPVFAGIGWIVKTEMAIVQLAAAIVVAFFRNVVAPTFMWLWHNIVQPVFHAISSIVRTEISVIRTIISTLVAFFRGTVAPVFTWLWRNVVTPMFNGIRDTISTVWNNGIKPVLTALANFVKNTLGAAFRTGVAAVTTAWNLLKVAAKTPISFVVNHVINPLIGGFNKVAKIFGTSQISPISGFAQGGRIPGAPSSRDNRVGSMVGRGGKFLGPIKVATGEFIVNAADTAKALPLLQWINTGMKGGPASASRRIGRTLTDMPGDGSEGWAFASGGLVGFMKDVWGAVSNPAKLIKSPLEAMVKRIPGGGLIRNVLAGMAGKLISGLVGWIGGSGGTGTLAPGNVGKAQKFVMSQNGKPYVWASAGPGGYDCSGIVSAVYNVMKGRSPYSHTFSTASLPGGWFHEGMRTGPLIAGWSHPGQAPASSSTGHMAGMIGGLPFESSGSRGVHMGASARGVGQFAHIGSAYASGGLARLSKIAMADSGRVTLDRGWNLIGNGTGGQEHLSAGGDIHLHFHGPVGSKQAAKDMILEGYNALVREKKIPQVKR